MARLIGAQKQILGRLEQESHTRLGYRPGLIKK
jgi:hypothetical protein